MLFPIEKSNIFVWYFVRPFNSLRPIKWNWIDPACFNIQTEFIFQFVVRVTRIWCHNFHLIASILQRNMLMFHV